MSAEDRRQLDALQQSFRVLQGIVDGADLAALSRTTERCNTDVKDLKKRLNEVELQQANLEGLVADEAVRAEKVTKLQSRVDTMETQIHVLRQSSTVDDAQFDKL
jgi:predicted nuclease with TOPRIM domain